MPVGWGEKPGAAFTSIRFFMPLQKSLAHYCQKCLAGNPFGREFCLRCGTRLMLVVEPPAARYESTDGATARSAYEEHLLERVSALENHLVRLSGRLE